MDELKNFLSSNQKKINTEIAGYFKKKILVDNPFEKKYLKILKEYSLRRPAKRLRSILVIIGYSLAGGKNKKAILEGSISIEMIHNFLLIHDDIIDRDTMRRGKETINYYYQKQLGLKRNESEHFGQSMGIVLGDIVNNFGYEILVNSNFKEKYKIKALKKVNEIGGLTGRGQMLEIDLKEKLKAGKKIKEKDVIDIYKFKTAFYTFVLPLQIGAILAGATESFLKKIEKFALPLGIIFQIRDDIQEIFEPSEAVERPLMSDVREGQPNLLIIKTLQKKNNKFRKYIGKANINQKEADNIRKLIVESGALQYCKDLVADLTAQVEKILLSENDFPKKEKQLILKLMEYLNDSICLQKK